MSRTGPTTIINALDRVRVATGHVLTDAERGQAADDLMGGQLTTCHSCQAKWPTSLVNPKKAGRFITVMHCPECCGPSWYVATMLQLQMGANP